MFQLSYLLSLCSAVVLLKLFSAALTHRRRKATAKLLGCDPVPCTNSDELFGFGCLKSLLTAYTNGAIPAWYIQKLDAVGQHAHTVQAKLVVGQPLITRDEKNIKAVLSAQVDDWELGELRRTIISHTGDNVFTLEGERWRHSRSLSRTAFSRESVANLAMYERHLQDCFLTCPVGDDGWTKVFDFQPTARGFAFDVITEMLYGYSTHTQNPVKRSQLAAQLQATDLPDAEDFFRNVVQLSESLGFSAMFGKWHKYVPAWNYYRNVHVVHQYAKWFVERRLRQMSSSKADSEPSLGAGFVLLNELSTIIQDPVQLRHEIIGFHLAGLGTTSALLGWLVYYLARSPKVYSKLRTAVLSSFGDEVDLKRMGFAELHGCEYVRACINEGLRLGSPQPATTRQALKDTVLPSGGGPNGRSPILVPKGTQVILNFFAMHHRADIWGSDVEEFRPERWEGKRNDWTFSAFGGGPRKCAGRKSPFFYQCVYQMASSDFSYALPEQLALTEVSYFLIRIVQRFDMIENVDPTDHTVFKSTITNRSGTGVVVKMHQAESVK